jgi:hypothetical protein
LTEIVHARDAFGVELGGVDGRQQEGGKNPDDGNHHEHFDQGKSENLPAARWRLHALSISSTGDAM